MRGQALAAGKPWWTMSPFGLGEEPETDLGVDPGVPSRMLEARPAEEYRGDLDAAMTDVGGWLREGYRVVIVH